MTQDTKRLGMLPIALLIGIGVIGLTAGAALYLLWTSSPVTTTVQIYGLEGKTIQAGSCEVYDGPGTITTVTATTLGTQKHGTNNMIEYATNSMIVCLTKNQLKPTDSLKIDVTITNGAMIPAWTLSGNIVDFHRTTPSGGDGVIQQISTQVFTGDATTKSFTFSNADVQKMLYDSTAFESNSGDGNALILKFVFSPYYDIDGNGTIDSGDISITVTMSAVSV